jgi:hypothetical protein
MSRLMLKENAGRRKKYHSQGPSGDHDDTRLFLGPLASTVAVHDQVGANEFMSPHQWQEMAQYPSAVAHLRAILPLETDLKALERSMRNRGELFTCATLEDLIMTGRIHDALEVITRRKVALFQSTTDKNWKLAQFMESRLVRYRSKGITPDAEVARKVRARLKQD